MVLEKNWNMLEKYYAKLAKEQKLSQVPNLLSAITVAERVL